MKNDISRRDIVGALALLPWAGGSAHAETAADNAAVAIIDTPDNAAERIAELRAKNVKTIGRYYARKFQSALPQKIMVAETNRINGVLEPKILTDNGFSILSAYQYKSATPEKFLNGLPDTGSRAAEAKADAKAALEQARKAQQPEGTAIYFGLDFNLTEFKYEANGRLIRDRRGDPVRNTEIIDACLDYFRMIKAAVGQHYTLGVYGNGFTNRLLRRENLITYSWISASRSYDQTSAFYSDGQWHLFQNQVDRRWFEVGNRCPSGLDVDTDVQNPNMTDIGSWGANGASGVEPARTAAVFAQRRFAIRRTNVYKEPTEPLELIGKMRCIFNDDHRWERVRETTVERNNNARIIADRGDWLELDIDDDGRTDGFARKSDFTANFRTMPEW